MSAATPEPEPVSPSPATYLAFDFGRRRIGVAVGQSITAEANALSVVGGGPDWAAIDRLMQEWRPDRVIVGLPLDGAGEETDMSRAAREFGQALHNRYGCVVDFYDERMTSRAAEAAFREARQAGTARRKDARLLDAKAAALILQGWLDCRPQTDAEQNGPE